MTRIGFLVVASVLLLGDGLVFGLMTNRWESSRELPAGVASLERVPMTVGEWRGTTLPKMNDRVLATAGFAGYLQRSYENHRTGAVVQILVACGPFGPLSVHTPEVCYAGSGFVQRGEKVLHTENLGNAAGDGQFWKIKFGRPETGVPGHILVFWSWNAGNGWQAVENPRWAFAGAPVLFKLYVSCGILGGDDAGAADNCQAFVRELLPELEKSLAFKP